MQGFPAFLDLDMVAFRVVQAVREFAKYNIISNAWQIRVQILAKWAMLEYPEMLD
jgi:hypothetical protein